MLVVETLHLGRRPVLPGRQHERLTFAVRRPIRVQADRLGREGLITDRRLGLRRDTVVFGTIEDRRGDHRIGERVPGGAQPDDQCTRRTLGEFVGERRSHHRHVDDLRRLDRAPRSHDGQLVEVRIGVRVVGTEVGVGAVVLRGDGVLDDAGTLRVDERVVHRNGRRIGGRQRRAIERQAVEGRLHQRLLVVDREHRQAGDVLVLGEHQRLADRGRHTVDRNRPADLLGEERHQLLGVRNRLGVAVPEPGVGDVDASQTGDGFGPVPVRDGDQLVGYGESAVTTHREDHRLAEAVDAQLGADGGGDQVVGEAGT